MKSVSNSLRNLLPSNLFTRLKAYQQMFYLNKLNHSTCDGSNLLSLDRATLNDIISNEKDKLWQGVMSKISDFDFPEMTGGVNYGDQRAIFYLINHFKPAHVLEIGTHIGCSTVIILLGLDDSNRLTTVDFRDVNDKLKKPWLNFGSRYAPEDIVSKLGLKDKVNFAQSDSIEYMRTCKDKFDFIFLDGSHDAKIVFEEVPLALSLLNKGGVILLHDYFPNLKPLWNDKPCIPGPYLALQKIQEQNKNLQVLPLGKLPWHTKLNSNFTSLAVLTKSKNLVPSLS